MQEYINGNQKKKVVFFNSENDKQYPDPFMTHCPYMNIWKMRMLLWVKGGGGNFFFFFFFFFFLGGGGGSQCFLHQTLIRILC